MINKSTLTVKDGLQLSDDNFYPFASLAILGLFGVHYFLFEVKEQCIIVVKHYGSLPDQFPKSQFT